MLYEAIIVFALVLVFIAIHFGENPRDKIRIRQYVAQRGGKSIEIKRLFSNKTMRSYQVSYVDVMGNHHETECRIHNDLSSFPDMYWFEPIVDLTHYEQQSLDRIETYPKSSKEQIIDDLTVENEALALENEQLREKLAETHS